jgi:TRAP-type mannitol/chloroaromatic compound transport system substrate-binding protein
MKRVQAPAALAALLAAVVALPVVASAAPVEIKFRRFSGAKTMGPQADAFAAKLFQKSSILLPGHEIQFKALPGVPALPAGKTVPQAVAEGYFQAAYNSGSELNPNWGFIYNSGVPFGPSFDEHIGFLYGKFVEGGVEKTGLDLVQEVMDAAGAGVQVIPIVGSSEQLSGFFPEPIGDVPGRRGIGLEGLCKSGWTLRYLPPAENVLKIGCDILVERNVIKADEKSLKFIAAVPGGGSLVAGLLNGTLDGFEFATPTDDVSQSFPDSATGQNPGTAGARYAHLPGWQQQFLITWMIIDKDVWNLLSPAQQELVYTVARDHVISSYGVNMATQGKDLTKILKANDGDPTSDMVLSWWPLEDQKVLMEATNRYLNANTNPDYVRVLEAYRKYVQSQDTYWDWRAVPSKERFEGWTNPLGESWESADEGLPCDGQPPGQCKKKCKK